MSNIRLLGFPNHVAEGYVVMSAEYPPSEPADMEAVFLKTEEPSERARIVSLDPRDTVWSGETSGIACTFDGFAVANHNIPPGGEYRFAAQAGGEDFGHLSFHRQAPSTIVASSNATGSASNVDEDIRSPDGSFISPTITTLPWAVTLGWGVLAETPSQGYGMACFVLRMQRFYVGAGADNPVTVPRVTVQLSEGGVAVRSLGYRAVTASAGGGQVLIFPFDPAELSDASGTNLECSISVLNGESESGSQYAALESVSLYFEDDLAPITYDSGWVTIEGNSLFQQPTRSFHYYPEQSWTNVLSFSLLIRSDQTRHDLPTRLVDDAIPAAAVDPTQDFVEAGVLCGGEAKFFERGIRHSSGPAARPVVAEVGQKTLSGQSYSTDSWRRRITEPLDIMVTRDEADFIRKAIVWSKGKSGAFYVTLEPQTSAERQMFSAFWATLGEASAPMPFGKYRTDGEMLLLMTISFEEKL